MSFIVFYVTHLTLKPDEDAAEFQKPLYLPLYLAHFSGSLSSFLCKSRTNIHKRNQTCRKERDLVVKGGCEFTLVE